MASDLEQPRPQLVSVTSSVKTGTVPATSLKQGTIAGWPERDRALTRRFRLGEVTIQGLLFLTGIISILTTIGIVVVLGMQSWLFFSTPGVSLLEFFTGTVWQPQIGRFGVSFPLSPHPVHDLIRQAGLLLFVAGLHPHPSQLRLPRVPSPKESLDQIAAPGRADLDTPVAAPFALLCDSRDAFGWHE